MKNKKLNIIIGKIGKTMKFRDWSIQGSESSPIIFYSTISKLNPNCNFYLIGKSSINKLTKIEYDKLFPNNNVINCYQNETQIIKKHNISNDEKYKIPYLFLKDNNVNVDAALIFSGFSSPSSNIPNAVLKVNVGVDGKIYATPLMAFKNYAANIIYTLNETQAPLYLISEDPRHKIINAKELVNNEKTVFSQENSIQKVLRFKDYDTFYRTDVQERKHFDIKIEYYHTEKIFLMGEKNDWRKRIDINKKINSDLKFNIICNGHGFGKRNNYEDPVLCDLANARYPFIEEYVFNSMKDCDFYDNIKVYGKWSDELHERDNRFIKKPLKDMKFELTNTKYTLINSIYPGFVTIKPFEMIMWGIIPFLHPDYDKNKLLNFPEYLYIKNPKDLLNKINELENDQEKYIMLLNECLDLIKPEYLDGTFLNNLIMNKIYNDLGLEYKVVYEGISDKDKVSHFSNGL